MTEHTKEPWEYRLHNPEGGNQSLYIEAPRDGRCSDGVAEIIPRGKGKLGEPDARRIVACVNACQGIPTEALEDGVVEEMVTAAKKYLETNYSEHRYALHNALAKLKDTPND